jgi:hypothetical protein
MGNDYVDLIAQHLQADLGALDVGKIAGCVTTLSFPLWQRDRQRE